MVILLGVVLLAIVLVTGVTLWDVYDDARQERRRRRLDILRRLERVTRPVDAPRPRIVAQSDRIVAVVAHADRESA